MTKRPVDATEVEVEITPEMIEAGRDAVLSEIGGLDCLPGFFSAEDLA